MKKIVVIVALVLVVCIIAAGVGIKILNFQREKEIQERARLFFGTEKLLHVELETMEGCRALFGEPLLTDEEYTDTLDDKAHYYTRFVYRDFTVVYVHLYSSFEKSFYIKFAHIIITNPNLELWRGGIKLGDTREEVEKAFGYLPPVPIVDNSYDDLWWAIGFVYDEQDKVSIIRLF